MPQGKQAGPGVGHLDGLVRESRRGAPLQVDGEVLVDVLEAEVEGHLPVALGTLDDVQQSGEREREMSFEVPTNIASEKIVMGCSKVFFLLVL